MFVSTPKRNESRHLLLSRLTRSTIKSRGIQTHNLTTGRDDHKTTSTSFHLKKREICGAAFLDASHRSRCRVTHTVVITQWRNQCSMLIKMEEIMTTIDRWVTLLPNRSRHTINIFLPLKLSIHIHVMLKILITYLFKLKKPSVNWMNLYKTFYRAF